PPPRPVALPEPTPAASPAAAVTEKEEAEPPLPPPIPLRPVQKLPPVRLEKPERDEPEPLPATRRAAIQAIPQHPVETLSNSFAELGLSEAVLKAVRHVGFEHPTPIQAAVIPPALSGRDIIGLAQTGSGKTAAFCLPVAERLTHGKGLRGLILSPTREIALQTKAFLDLFGEDHHLETSCLIGGVAMGPQISELRGKPDIVVATPGRLLDHLRRRNLSLSAVSELVLDEADHMLDLGFMPQIQEVLSYLPTERQTLMFSATMPEAIERLAQRLLQDPIRIDILPPGRAAEGITHRLYLVEEEDKRACLAQLLHEELGSTLVFIRRKIDAEWLSRILEREGHPVVRIHSDLSQTERIQALEGFREGEHRILVATDIAARGLDVPRIQHIINYDLPETVEDYIHRAGRTARGRLKGLVSSIATWQDKAMIKEIEEALGFELPRCTVAGVEPWVEGKARPRGRRFIPVRRRL
ncbi:MAG TPA: DEAD/DEAH box helicase, partial [Thermoanaerobaculia bacterium]|nr:DEAD/DEAH box helicase [Thermoanaerobaculia bacterium]